MNSPYGQITWWGFTPSIDLLDLMTRHEHEFSENDSEETNILLVGTGDGRSILQTISKLYNHKNRKVNFYVEESSLETVARQILLLNLTLECHDVMNIQEKTEMFLELFGNSLIRNDTELYLVKQANDFIKMITDPTYAEKSYPLFDLSNLKYKERDQLEGIFKFWRNQDKVDFDISKHWDYRVRQHLGIRYDFRENAYDWEYSINLKEKASIVNWHEYKKWRETGLAFKIRDDTAYEVPNRTLASGIVFKKDSERIPKRGYWGDIMNSPYVAFGIQSCDQSLFVKNNNMHIKTSTDVTFTNVKSAISELMTGVEFQQESNTNIVISELGEKDDEKPPCTFNFSNVKIVFLPLESVGNMHKKSKYRRRFDFISYSNSMVHHLDNTVSMLFRNKQSLLMIESTKFMLDVKPEIHVEYGKKIEAMAKNAGCELDKTFDAENHEYAMFKFEES